MRFSVLLRMLLPAALLAGCATMGLTHPDRFSSLRPGMTRAQVDSAIGGPDLKGSLDDSYGWTAYKSWHGTTFTVGRAWSMAGSYNTVNGHPNRWPMALLFRGDTLRAWNWVGSNTLSKAEWIDRSQAVTDAVHKEQAADSLRKASGASAGRNR